MSITLNPGFAILIGAALALIAPRALRAGVTIAAALAALFLIFEPDFGAAGAFAQIGLTITPLRLDPLAQIFGLGFALTTIVLALFAMQRDDRVEDVALMALAGGALTAVFAGDLVSFIAAAQFSALAGAVPIFRGPGPGALGAGQRYLGWQSLAGALTAAGAGLSWAATGGIGFEQMSPRTWHGALMLAGMAIMAGAPIAHVWLKDALPRTSALGGAALAAFGVKLGLYGLARAFQGEPLLLYLGAVAAVGALPLAALSQDVREAGAYGIVSQTGAAMAAVGAGTPLALAGASALSFASSIHGTLALLALGLACERAGGGRIAAVGGLARSMPVTALLAIAAALSAMAAPGFAGFAAASLHADALAREEHALVWIAVTAAGAGAALHFGARLPYLVFFGADSGKRPADAGFAAQLAMGIAAFFCLAIGAAPSWLYGLLPSQIYFHPYDWDHLIRQGELIAFAWLATIAATMIGAFPAGEGGVLVEFDWLLRRGAKPVLLSVARRLLAAYDDAKAKVLAAWTAVNGVIGVLAREADQPAAPDAAGLVWLLIILTLAMIFLFSFQG